jgi:hypothetical protein
MYMLSQRKRSAATTANAATVSAATAPTEHPSQQRQQPAVEPSPPSLTAPAVQR